MDIHDLSKSDRVRRLGEEDVDAVYDLCQGNSLY